jgi:hypothetical protein
VGDRNKWRWVFDADVKLGGGQTHFEHLIVAFEFDSIGLVVVFLARIIPEVHDILFDEVIEYFQFRDLGEKLVEELGIHGVADLFDVDIPAVERI